MITALGWVAGEWHSVRPKESNLYQINMGMCTPLSMGLALALPHRRVTALESDGSVLLYLGNLATLANKRPPNLTVIVFDNECYLATGGLPTATAGGTSLAGVAKAAGIEHSFEVNTVEDFEGEVREALGRAAPSFIVAKVNQESSRRSTNIDGKEAKYRFVRYIEKSEGIKIIGTHSNRPD
ncbi:MAG: thiamine pyrophosphate-binding protein [Deltaproteobacteria bacterium]|nr:thiamine pyrophosphate-binding protein [Deltaproteobacteria bacterium]